MGEGGGVYSRISHCGLGSEKKEGLRKDMEHVKKIVYLTREDYEYL